MDTESDKRHYAKLGQHVREMFERCPPTYIERGVGWWIFSNLVDFSRTLTLVCETIAAHGYQTSNSSDQNYWHYHRNDGSVFKMYISINQASLFFWASYFAPPNL